MKFISFLSKNAKRNKKKLIIESINITGRIVLNI